MESKRSLGNPTPDPEYEQKKKYLDTLTMQQQKEVFEQELDDLEKQLLRK